MNPAVYGAPGIMSNAGLETPWSPLATATIVNPYPTLLIVQPLNVATPATAVLLSPPLHARVAPVGLTPSASVTGVVAPDPLVTTLPAASRIDTTGWGESSAPTAVSPGDET